MRCVCLSLKRRNAFWLKAPPKNVHKTNGIEQSSHSNFSFDLRVAIGGVYLCLARTVALANFF